MSALHAVHALLTGRVQGVGFRYFTRTVADELELTGWVRNLPDGRVELFAHGDRDTLEALLERLEAAFPGARVDDLAASWTTDLTDSFPDFAIRR